MLGSGERYGVHTTYLGSQPDGGTSFAVMMGGLFQKIAETADLKVYLLRRDLTFTDVAIRDQRMQPKLVGTCLHAENLSHFHQVPLQ